MLVNLVHGSPREHRRLLVAGVAFISTLALLVGLSIAIYDKAFTSKTLVTLEAKNAGLQLSRFGDVRMHGALVGYVDDVSSNGRQARIRLALRPEAARNIPANISAQILPTTLFGQNYVQLSPASDGVNVGSLREGQVIPSSRVTTNVTLQEILANLYPVLRAIRPEDVNTTLYALAHALQGKGDQIGETMVALDDYLTTINAETPTLKADLKLFAQVAGVYNEASPDLLDTLRHITVTARTVSDRKSDLKRALKGLTTMSVATRTTLQRNKKLLIAQGRSGTPLLKLLATYSPEVPCLLEGMTLQIPNTKNVFAPNMIHQTLELGAPQRTAYTAADAPVYGEVGHGPWCLGLPDHYEMPAPFLPLKDGTDKDNRDGGMK